MLGVLFPIIAKRARSLRIPSWIFFSVKHFGTGVIIATAFIHVLFFTPRVKCDRVTD